MEGKRRSIDFEEEKLENTTIREIVYVEPKAFILKVVNAQQLYF